MFRNIILVALAALIGSGLATMIWVGWEGGTGAPDPAGFVMGFALSTMMFTVPGVIMLIGLQAILSDRGMAVLWRDFFVLLFAAFAGAAILSFLSFDLAALGTVYALTTAITLVSLQRLLNRVAQD